MRTIVLCVIVAWAGCGGGGDATSPEDGGGTGADLAQAGGDLSSQGTDLAQAAFDAAGVCAKIAAQVSSCAPAFASQCPTIFANAQARGCGSFLPALETWVKGNGNAYGCANVPGFGPQPTIANAAPEAAHVADACAGAVNQPACYAISCTSSLDCPSGAGCNDATGHCFDNASRLCAGLPCKGSLDCPSLHTCNAALGVCVKS